MHPAPTSLSTARINLVQFPRSSDTHPLDHDARRGVRASVVDETLARWGSHLHQNLGKRTWSVRPSYTRTQSCLWKRLLCPAFSVNQPFLTNQIAPLECALAWVTVETSTLTGRLILASPQLPTKSRDIRSIIRHLPFILSIQLLHMLTC